MIARNKQAVQTDGRTESALFARNRQDLARVLVSYRTFSQRWALYGAFGVKLFPWPSKVTAMRRSVAALVTAVASGRLDIGEGNEVEIDDGLKRVGRRAVAQAVGQCREPIGIFGLQRQQFDDCVTPTLGAAARAHA